MTKEYIFVMESLFGNDIQFGWGHVVVSEMMKV